ncbi:hypothetical protein ACEQUB_00156 [Ralstonia syzygii]
MLETIHQYLETLLDTTQMRCAFAPVIKLATHIHVCHTFGAPHLISHHHLPPLYQGQLIFRRIHAITCFLTALKVPLRLILRTLTTTRRTVPPLFSLISHE